MPLRAAAGGTVELLSAAEVCDDGDAWPRVQRRQRWYQEVPGDAMEGEGRCQGGELSQGGSVFLFVRIVRYLSVKMVKIVRQIRQIVKHS